MVEFIVYAIAFRLAVIASGLACVYMGYRLFILGVMPGGGGSEIGADAGAIKLTVKNAAPGTVFATFGALLIIVMLVQGMPELNRTESAAGSEVTRALTMRGEDETVAESLARGRALERAGDADAAIRAYAGAFDGRDRRLAEIAAPLRAIAGVYQAQGRHDEAAAYAGLANEIDRDDAAGLALWAEAQHGRGETGLAIRAMERAVALDPSLAAKLDALRTRQ